jgi:hypothetical protein
MRDVAVCFCVCVKRVCLLCVYARTQGLLDASLVEFVASIVVC